MDSSSQAVPASRIQENSNEHLVSPVDVRDHIVRALPPSGRPLAAELWRYTKTSQLPLELLTKGTQNVEDEVRIGDLEGASRDHRGVNLIRGQALESIFASIPQFEWREQLGAASLQDRVAVDHFTALTSSTALVIERGVHVREPIVVEPLWRGSRDLSAPWVVVVASPDSRATLVIDERVSGPTLFAPWYEFVVGAGASLQVVVIQRLPENAKLLGRHRFHLLRDSTLSLFECAVGGRTARVDLDCVLHQPGATANMWSATIAGGSQHLDLHPTQTHRAPNGTSRLHAKAAVQGRARNVYYGMIDVAVGAQQTDAYQKSANILLSPSARADAIPNLQIGANDVKCSHGATVGQIDEEEIFYAMSRGLSRAHAEQLIVDGFFQEATERISDESVRCLVAEELAKAMKHAGRNP